jgi:hypothetical protein
MDPEVLIPGTSAAAASLLVQDQLAVVAVAEQLSACRRGPAAMGSVVSQPRSLYCMSYASFGQLGSISRAVSSMWSRYGAY